MSSLRQRQEQKIMIVYYEVIPRNITITAKVDCPQIVMRLQLKKKDRKDTTDEVILKIHHRTANIKQIFRSLSYFTDVLPVSIKQTLRNLF